jgi:hypothetical protein
VTYLSLTLVSLIPGLAVIKKNQRKQRFQCLSLAGPGEGLAFIHLRKEVTKVKYLLTAIALLITFGCSSARNDQEITNRIIQLIENQPNSWVSIETLRNLTYNFNSNDGKEEITLSIRKTVPSTAVMFSPYKVEFSPDSSAKLESEFSNWYSRRLKTTQNSDHEMGEETGPRGKESQLGGLDNLHSQLRDG